ncbi:MAG: flagellar biosynthesis protein FlgE [Spongiibacteraceae bacterium]|nr:flagellar biosynthesis protein FlgE [Spongiibacteraceae bacterium]
MAINSILTTGIQGVKNGIETTQTAAQTIARSTLPNAVEDSSNGLDTLTDAVVDLKVGENQVKASAAVIKTADEILGTLLDTKA